MANSNGDAGIDRISSLAGRGFSQDCVIHMCNPFGDMRSAYEWAENCFAPLNHALPDCECREFISIMGETPEGAMWIGSAGHYMGTFQRPFLDIPPSGQLAHMRFHEFYKIEQGEIKEVQAIWDIPELMIQARAWPMAPSLGREFCVPSPMTQDGLIRRQGDDKAEASLALVIDMLNDMVKHPAQGGEEVMNLPKYWHPKMNWYGPAAIGTARGIDGFRRLHQIPFLNAMPDRGQNDDDLTFHFFADLSYVAVTGWPNMVQTITGDGWMGIAPAGQEISLRSLDFWRIEGGKIRENWVLVDLLDIYNQIGVDVLARMREFTNMRGGVK